MTTASATFGTCLGDGWNGPPAEDVPHGAFIVRLVRLSGPAAYTVSLYPRQGVFHRPEPGSRGRHLPRVFDARDDALAAGVAWADQLAAA